MSRFSLYAEIWRKVSLLELWLAQLAGLKRYELKPKYSDLRLLYWDRPHWVDGYDTIDWWKHLRKPKRVMTTWLAVTNAAREGHYE